MYYYAQLNEAGVCIGMSQLSGAVESPQMIALTEAQYLTDLIGCPYENGVWGKKPDPEPTEPSPTETEKIWAALNAQAAAVEEQTKSLEIILGAGADV